MSRTTTAEGVLETIYSLAGVSGPGHEEPIFRGHPLAVAPRGAATFYYGIWPAIVLAAAAFAHYAGRQEDPVAGMRAAER